MYDHRLSFVSVDEFFFFFGTFRVDTRQKFTRILAFRRRIALSIVLNENNDRRRGDDCISPSLSFLSFRSDAIIVSTVILSIAPRVVRYVGNDDEGSTSPRDSTQRFRSYSMRALRNLKKFVKFDVNENALRNRTRTSVGVDSQRSQSGSERKTW